MTPAPDVAPAHAVAETPETARDPEPVDALVVGAGPAGATAAAHLAAAGWRVRALEKTSFPREKVCGDGLTPRAVRELRLLGVGLDPADGWHRVCGLRMVAGRHAVEVPFPRLEELPDFGLVRPRSGLDSVLAENARRAGAEVLEDTTVTGAVVDDRTGRVVGVRARPTGRRDAPEVVHRARVVVAADGVSARTALSLGLARREDRPLGVAVRTYYRSPRHDDPWLESWLELPDTETGGLLPGYGWLFGVGDGTVNVGLGILNSSAAFGTTDYRALLRRWVAGVPGSWGLGEDTRTAPVRGAALPMAFNRTPQYRPGLLLVGDAAGDVNPFNGEGIAYAMESARIAAHAVSAGLARGTTAGCEARLAEYPGAVRAAWGRYFTLGRMFVAAIGRPAAMRLAVRLGTGVPGVMDLAVRWLGGLVDVRRPDAAGRVLAALEAAVPVTRNDR